MDDVLEYCIGVSSQSIRLGSPGVCVSSLPLFTRVRGRGILGSSSASSRCASSLRRLLATHSGFYSCLSTEQFVFNPPAQLLFRGTLTPNTPLSLEVDHLTVEVLHVFEQVRFLPRFAFLLYRAFPYPPFQPPPAIAATPP